MTMTEAEPDILDDLDFDAVCDVAFEECDRPAAVAVKRICPCGLDSGWRLACHPHQVGILVGVRKGLWGCNACGMPTTVSHYRWRPL